MTKAGLESASQAYARAIETAKKCEKQRNYKSAVAGAFSAWPFVTGMMQFVAKYEERTVEFVEAFDIVFAHCPCLLDMPTLDALQRFLEGEKRRFKSTVYGSGDIFARAKASLREYHRLAVLLTEVGELIVAELSDRLGGQQIEWGKRAKIWMEMGLITATPERRSHKIQFATRLGMLTVGKCPACGACNEAPKSMFLETQACQNCGVSSVFVLIGSETDRQQNRSTGD